MEEEKDMKEEKTAEEKEAEKLRNKRNSFTLIYILVGIFLIAILGILLYSYLVSKYLNRRDTPKSLRT